MRYMRQLHQRRMTAFYLLPQGSDVQATLGRQLRFEHFAPTADRPRTLRELFADTEYEDEDELP